MSVNCPECGTPSGKDGKKRGKQSYRCPACNRQFVYEPNEFNPPEGKPNPLVLKILERYTPEELRAISEGASINPHARETPAIDFSGDTYRLGFFTDPHWGSRYTNDSLWIAFLAECARRKVDALACAGDMHEGMSNRPDQVYQLEDIGFSAQMEHSERLLKMTNLDIYTVDGNHDRWGIKSGGLYMVKDLAKRVPNLHFIGHDVGDIDVKGTKWRLWHGEDWSSYATSYRIQQVIQSITGGDKPHVLLLGHTHKQAYIFDRNVHAVSGGALSYQTDWMRSKRLPCHTGFHIIEAVIRDAEIQQFTLTWYPYYR